MTATSTRSPVDGGADRAADAAPGRVLAWVLVTAAAAVATLVGVLLAGGGAPHPLPAGLPDPGAVTGWGLPLARLASDAAGVLTVGFLLTAALLLPNRGGRLDPTGWRAADLAGYAALSWAGGVLVQLGLSLSDLLGAPPSQVLTLTALRSYVVSTAQGRALFVQAGLAVLVAVAARFIRTAGAAGWSVLLALAALTPPVLTGHSAAAGNHNLAVSSLLVHVIAAAGWVGGLAALSWAAWRWVIPFGVVVPRFSRLALGCALVVGGSGVLNATARLPTASALLGTAYGRLVLAKAAALAVLVALGWMHRRRTLPRLEAGPRPGRAFTRLAAVEVVAMAATLALAVGLSRTPTPTPAGGTAADAAVRAVLGYDLPPAPTLGRLLLGLQVDVVWLTLILLAGLGYAAGVRALRRRGDRWPAGRTASWVGGLLLVAWATCGGLAAYAPVLFSAHMGQHMVLNMLAPIPLALAAPITLALRALPRGRTPDERGPRDWLLAVVHSTPVSFLGHPLIAWALFVGSLYALYFSPLLGILMSNHLGHLVMSAHFLAVGLLFFWVLLGVDPAPRPLPPPARLGLLFAAVPFHAFFAVAVMSGSTPLAPDYYALLGRPYGIDLLADQHTGGGLTWALGELPLLAVLAVVVLQWIRADERTARRQDRADSRAGSDADALAEYNRYLARLHARTQGRPDR